MNNKQSGFDRRRTMTVVIALLSVAVLVLTGLLLSGCRKKSKTSDTPSASGTPSSDGTASLDTPSNPADIQGNLYSKREGTLFLSPASVSVTDSAIFVADATNFAVYRLSLDGKIQKTVTFDSTVSKALAKEGKVYILSGELDGTLYVFNEDLTLEKNVKVGHTPSDVYVNGSTAYVANRFSNTVSVVDLSAGKVTSTIDVSREPTCMTVSGNFLYVGCRLQDGASTNKVLSSKIEKIDMSSGKLVKSIPLQDGAQGIRGIAASNDGKIIVTHTVARYAYPTSQLDRGWINTNGFSIIDTSTDTPVAFLLDEVEKGAGNPWDVEVSSDGKRLIFSIAGTGELMTVDYDKLKTRLSKVNDGKDSMVSSASDIINHIEFLAGIKTRTKLGGKGVRDIEVYGDKVYAAEYFTGDIVVADAKCETISATYSLGEQPEITPERQGESIWFDASFCYQQWESCSSCHPDARPDALNWDEGNDGWGTPKNTKSMMFSLRTPPVLVTGLKESGEVGVMESVRGGILSDMSEEMVGTIYAYLRSLLPVDSPYLTSNGTYTESALRGKELFEEVGCAKCHPAPLYTDLKFHKSPFLGSDGSWEDREFITPTLVEIWRSAPYTYTGAVTDIKKVIGQFASRALSDTELEDLAQFVLSIGVVEENYGVEQLFFKDSDGKILYSKIQKGATLTSFTVRKQIPSASGVGDPVITARLCDKSGKVLEEKTFTPGKMVYNTNVSLEWGLKIPENLAEGAYIEIVIKDSAGKNLASTFRLTYSK